jgi:hypothetical protein
VTSEERQPFKAIAVWSLIIAGGLVTAAIAFISLVSVWQGFTQIHRSASWVPIVAGALALGISLWAYLLAVKALRRRLKEPEPFAL